LTRRVPPQVSNACRRSVKRGTRAAICPELVPDVKPVADPKLSGPIAPRNSRGYSLMSFNNGFAGRHFILGTGSRRWFARWIFDARSNESGGKPRRLANLRVDGTTVRLYSFSGGPNTGHVGAVVRRPDGLEAFASMHRRRYTDAVVLMALDLSRQPRS
jgi:hypothetical protein